MNNFDYSLLRAVVIAAGGSPLALDSIHDLLGKWATAVGATPLPLDSRNDLLRKTATALGAGPLPGDNNVKILQRVAGLGSGYGVNDCLQAVLSSTSAPLTPVNFSAAEFDGYIRLLWDLAPSGAEVLSVEFQRKNVTKVDNTFDEDWTDFTPGIAPANGVAGDTDLSETIGFVNGEYRMRAVGLSGASSWTASSGPVSWTPS
jgi:hypothetical protein